MFKKIFTYFKNRSYRKVQLRYLRLMVVEDHRWFASVPGAKEITERYEILTRDDWYLQDWKSQSVLRDEIILKQEKMLIPKYNKEIEVLKANITRLNKDKEELQRKVNSLHGKLRKCQKTS